jgi:type II secretory ATPase GspE/PulE/Tfp pilus assembly ATPase PilB-like protein
MKVDEHCARSAGWSPRWENLAEVELDPEALRVIPAEFARRHCLFPLALRNGTILVASAAPGDPQVIEDIRLLSGLEVEEWPAPAADILERIAEAYRLTVGQMIKNLHPQDGKAGESRNLHDIEVMANEPTVINLVNLIISTALEERASDIHLMPFENSLQLRYRIDGLLQEQSPPPKTAARRAHLAGQNHGRDEYR